MFTIYKSIKSSFEHLIKFLIFSLLGHLNGKLDRHFTPEACPVYHNTTKKTCQTLKNQVNKKNRDRDKATTSMATKSPLGSPSAEQRHYSDKVR